MKDILPKLSLLDFDPHGDQMMMTLKSSNTLCRTETTLIILALFCSAPFDKHQRETAHFQGQGKLISRFVLNMKDAIGTLQETITYPTLGKGKSSTQKYLGMGYVGPQVVGTFFHVVFPHISFACERGCGDVSDAADQH